MITDLMFDCLAILLYSVVGVVLMALGFVLVDLVTPGNLRKQVWREHNRNGAILLASNMVSLGMIVAAAIYVSEGNLVVGLASSFMYGIIGLIVMGLSFVLLDVMTPGKLGKILITQENHPAVWVSASVHFAVGLIIVAGLS
ncbi:MAG TPA: DUF350 domain-containing protein [Candidatus Stackebrandtia faecavium]|nr:DUF350 domain-containing protein [Candidatus Stackebrandtia faecavium]